MVPAPPEKGSIMKRMIRYKVKADRVAENESLIAKVYEELHRLQPPGLRYATLRLDDGVSFVHIVSYEQADSNNALTTLPAFKAFAAEIRDRCEDQPVTNELKEIGSYGFFGK
jgi:quinol monooxygenase YgiN